MAVRYQAPRKRREPHLATTIYRVSWGPIVQVVQPICTTSNMELKSSLQ